MWLLSLSRTSLITGEKVLVPRWPKDWLTEAKKIMQRVMRGAGDEDRQRLFRMNLTLCLHRALTEEEAQLLPPLPKPWQGIAGGPVEVLWETVPGGSSTKPCEAPGHQPLHGSRDLEFGWIPVDCGACAPCQARKAA